MTPSASGKNPFLGYAAPRRLRLGWCWPRWRCPGRRRGWSRRCRDRRSDRRGRPKLLRRDDLRIRPEDGPTVHRAEHERRGGLRRADRRDGAWIRTGGRTSVPAMELRRGSRPPASVKSGALLARLPRDPPAQGRHVEPFRKGFVPISEVSPVQGVAMETSQGLNV